MSDIEMALEFEAQTGSWTVAGRLEAAGMTDQQRAIVRVLEKSEGAMSPTQIGLALGKSPSAVGHTLHILLASGSVVRNSGRYSLPHQAHSTHRANDESLASDEPDEADEANEANELSEANEAIEPVDAIEPTESIEPNEAVSMEDETLEDFDRALLRKSDPATIDGDLQQAREAVHREVGGEPGTSDLNCEQPLLF